MKKLRSYKTTTARRFTYNEVLQKIKCNKVLEPQNFDTITPYKKRFLVWFSFSIAEAVGNSIASVLECRDVRTLLGCFLEGNVWEVTSCILVQTDYVSQQAVS